MSWKEANQQVEHDEFVAAWADNPQQAKKAYQRLKDFMAAQDSVEFSFKARPGVSFSLRAAHANQKKRQLFVMLDIIDDDPANRWLSICFYGEMVSDPEEKGDLIPEGLLGEDGYCFDLEEWNEDDLSYLEGRLAEACRNAAQEA